MSILLALAVAWPLAASTHRATWRAEWIRSGLDPQHRERLAAQVEVESSWNPRAVSPSGAVGIAQFMRGTERLMERAYARELASLGGRRNVRWSFRAMFLLMRENLRAFHGAPKDERWKYAAAAYNGGPGYLRREQRRAGTWEWRVVREHCREFRSMRACEENVAYPIKILKREKAYVGF